MRRPRVLAEGELIREALAPSRPQSGHRFEAPAREYALMVAGLLRTIRIVD